MDVLPFHDPSHVMAERIGPAVLHAAQAWLGGRDSFQAVCFTQHSFVCGMSEDPTDYGGDPGTLLCACGYVDDGVWRAGFVTVTETLDCRFGRAQDVDSLRPFCEWAEARFSAVNN